MRGRKIAAFSAMLACAALLLGGCGAEKAVEKTDKSVKPVMICTRFSGHRLRIE